MNYTSKYKFSEKCNGKGYTIRKSTELKKVMFTVMKKNKLTMIDVHVGHFEPPNHHKTDLEFITKIT